MSVSVNKIINENIDKIKIGSCIEFNCICEKILSDVNDLNLFFESNSILFDDVFLSIINENINCLSCHISSFSHLVLNCIDDKEVYCDYSIKHY